MRANAVGSTGDEFGLVMSQNHDERKSNGSCESQRPEDVATDVHYYLLASTAVLAAFNLFLILIVVVGYCRFLKGRKIDRENGNVGTNRMKTSGTTSETESKSVERTRKESDDNSISVIDFPTKMRKRSLAFSETDEESRKYRENMEDTYDPTADAVEAHENGEISNDGEKTFRKKSVVTFVGVEESK